MEDEGIDEAILDGLKEQVLKDYVESIFIPIQNYQEDLNTELFGD